MAQLNFFGTVGAGTIFLGKDFLTISCNLFSGTAGFIHRWFDPSTFPPRRPYPHDSSPHLPCCSPSTPSPPFSSTHRPSISDTLKRRTEAAPRASGEGAQGGTPQRAVAPTRRRRSTRGAAAPMEAPARLRAARPRRGPRDGLWAVQLHRRGDCVAAPPWRRTLRRGCSSSSSSPLPPSPLSCFD